MKWKKLTLLFVLAVVAFLFLNAEAKARNCRAEDSPCEAYGSSSAIFTGLVTGVGSTMDNGSEFRTYQVNVEQAFLGDVDDTIESIYSDADCGYAFTVGTRYLIYAHDMYKGRFNVTYCSRTRPIEGAEDDLAFLRDEHRNQHTVRIYGSVLWERYYSSEDQRHPPCVGAHITVDGEGSQYDLVTDDTGRFEIRDLKPGAYSIEVKLPNGALVAGTSKRTHRVNESGCGRVQFWVSEMGKRSTN